MNAETKHSLCNLYCCGSWHGDVGLWVVMEGAWRTLWKWQAISCSMRGSHASCSQTWVWQIQSSLSLPSENYCFPRDFRWQNMMMMARVLIFLLFYYFFLTQYKKVLFLRSWRKQKIARWILFKKKLVQILAVVPILWIIICVWSVSSAYWVFPFLLFLLVIHGSLKPGWLCTPNGF